MENRNDPRNRAAHHTAQSGRRPAHTSAQRPRSRSASYDPDTVDRYNYVDREIYSSSSAQRRRLRKPAKRKRGCAGKFFVSLFVILLVAAVGGFLYFHIMASRLDRSEGVNSATLAQYVQQPSAAPSWDVKTEHGIMNILLLGVDENEDGSDGRSDSNMLLSVDSANKKLRLVSFLRDSYLEIPTHGKNKLNSAYAAGGVALTMQTLENNYRIDISRYVSIDFDNFAAVIDKMGGLDVPMSAGACRQENANIGTHFKAGTNHLNGKQCLYYARIRDAQDSFGHDDYGRAGRQRQVVQLMIAKAKSMNLVQSSKLLYDYLPYVHTNLTDGELAYLASIGATLSSYETESQQMPAPGTFDDQTTVKGIGSVITLDLKKNCTILRQFLYGDSSSSAVSGN
jgi:LCP family protein required for cell wall assembly